jgi:hypothetical protein
MKIPVGETDAEPFPRAKRRDRIRIRSGPINQQHASTRQLHKTLLTMLRLAEKRAQQALGIPMVRRSPSGFRRSGVAMHFRRRLSSRKTSSEFFDQSIQAGHAVTEILVPEKILD